AVLTAGQEAEDAIVGYVKAQERTSRLVESVNAAQRTVDISYDQYREGIIDFTPVFLFEGTLAEQQDALAVSRGEIAQNLINLYRSVGGGWEVRGAGNGAAATQPSTRPAGPPNAALSAAK